MKDMSSLRVRAELVNLLGMALVGLRTACEVYDADDQVLSNVQAGLRELGLDPDKMYFETTRPDTDNPHGEEALPTSEQILRCVCLSQPEEVML